jgi:hypothetical protein
MEALSETPAQLHSSSTFRAFCHAINLSNSPVVHRSILGLARSARIHENAAPSCHVLESRKTPRIKDSSVLASFSCWCFTTSQVHHSTV